MTGEPVQTTEPQIPDKSQYSHSHLYKPSHTPELSFFLFRLVLVEHLTIYNQVN